MNFNDDYMIVMIFQLEMMITCALSRLLICLKKWTSWIQKRMVLVKQDYWNRFVKNGKICEVISYKRGTIRTNLESFFCK